jgi:hypothetical protein
LLISRWCHKHIRLWFFFVYSYVLDSKSIGTRCFKKRVCKWWIIRLEVPQCLRLTWLVPVKDLRPAHPVLFCSWVSWSFLDYYFICQN